MVKLSKLFAVNSGNKLDMNKMSAGHVNFVGRSGFNQGITGKVSPIDGITPYPAGLITVALGGTVLSSFLQTLDFYTGQNVVVLYPKTEWKPFSYNDLFAIKKGRRLTKAEMIDGTTPYIGSSDANNGLTAMIGQPPIHEANTISLSYNGSVGEAFYQPKVFWATDDVNVLYPLFKMNSATALFICALIRNEKYRYNYGRKWTLDKMNKSIIKLPVKNDGSPDFDFMENYIKSLPYSSQI